MQLIKLSCTLSKVTYKHDLTQATSQPALGFDTHGTGPLWMAASDRSGESMQRRRPPFANVHNLSRGCAAWRLNAGSRRACRGHAQRRELFVWLVLQRGRKHAPACLTGDTNLRRLYFSPRGRMLQEGALV